MITLRPYQDEALDAVMGSIMSEQFMLLQAPTGAGKTIMFATLVQRLMQQYNMRILILAHREILIGQTVERMRQVWSEVPVSMACASAGEVDFSMPVVVGSIQTVASRINELPAYDLVIIDEAHRLQPRGEIDQYGLLSSTRSDYNVVLERLLQYQPATRVLGVTATPFRLGHGYIYGSKCRPGIVNWFPRLVYQITLRQLIETGALVPFHGMIADDMIGDELSLVRKSGGDYNEKALSEVMSRVIHLDAAVEAYRQHFDDRQHAVVFCVDIAHAEALAARFRDSGVRAEAMHSRLSKDEREQIMARFECGACSVLLNVGILVEGWDCPKANLVMFCRPTLSPALYIQMLGRGLRIFPGKDDCLLLDLAGNYQRHGHPDTPKVKIPRGSNGATEGDEWDDEPLPSERTCDRCNITVTTRAWICPECNHILVPQGDIPTLRQLKADGTIAAKDMMADVTNCRAEPYRSRAGNDMIRFSVTVLPTGASKTIEILIFPDFSGHRAIQWRQWWQSVIKTVPPRSNAEAIQREWKIPYYCTICQDGEYWKVGTWIHA